MRNSLVAHNLRTKDNTMIFRTQMDYEAPRGPYEIELLNDIIQMISFITKMEFQSEVDYARNNFKLSIPTYQGFSKEDCWQIMEDLIVDTNYSLKKFNKPYSIKFKKNSDANIGGKRQTNPPQT